LNIADRTIPLGWRPACGEKIISNIEQGMPNAEAIGQRKKLHHSQSHARYSFREQGIFIIWELPNAEDPAEHLQSIILEFPATEELAYIYELRHSTFSFFASIG
jgi:hypothetical protein